MKKQVKLLTLVALMSMSSAQASGMKNYCKDPKGFVAGLLDTKSNSSVYKLAAAVAAGTIASTIADRSYDDKGKFRSMNDAADPMMEDALYCLAEGCGWSFVESLAVKKTQSLTEMGKESLVNSAAIWLTNLISKQNVYRSLDRNHPLFKGWVPFNVKFDDTFKKVVTAFGVRAVMKAVLPGVTTTSADTK